MKPATTLLVSIAVLCIAACEFKTDFKIQPAAAKIRNGIQLKTNKFIISQAFLVDQEGKLIDDDNLVKPNEYITLRLFIDTGWTVTNNIVKLGASEKIETSEGEVILDEKDLFAGNDVVSHEDAKVIALKVIINKVDKLYDYYLVNFRVWDKNGDGEVTGSYKFNLK